MELSPKIVTASVATVEREHIAMKETMLAVAAVGAACLASTFERGG